MLQNRGSIVEHGIIRTIRYPESFFSAVGGIKPFNLFPGLIENKEIRPVKTQPLYDHADQTDQVPGVACGFANGFFRYTAATNIAGVYAAVP